MYDVDLSIVVRNAEGALKDVFSEGAQGIGSLRPGRSAYFYIELDGLQVADGDVVEGYVVRAAKSFLYR